MKHTDKNDLPQLLERIEGAEKWRDGNFRDKFLDCYRRWRSQPLEKREGCNLFVGLTFMIENVISSRVAGSLFANRPAVSVLPRGEGDLDRAEIIQTLLDWQMCDRAKLPRLFAEDIIPRMNIYGTAITYTTWSRKTRNVTKNQAGSGEAGEEGPRPVRRQLVEEDDPRVASIDLLQFFVDPRAEDLRSAAYCGHQEFRSRPDLERMARERDWEVDWEKLSPASRVVTGQSLRYESAGLSRGEERGDLYEVHHYWEQDRYAVILGRSQLVQDGPNPFWHGRLPYDRCCYLYLPGEFYGAGLPELVGQLQDELNTVRNQRIDYNSLALRRMWKLRRGCGLTSRDLIWRQNGVLQVENMDDVQEISLQALPGNAFANEAGIKQDMKDITGCHDIIMGLAEADETATTTRTKDNNASIRFRQVCRAISDDLLLPIAEKFFSLDQQYMSEEKRFRISGDQDPSLRRVSPFDLVGDYDYHYVGTAMDPLSTKEQAEEKLTSIINLVRADELYKNAPEARLELYRRLFNALEQKDVDKLLPEAAAEPNPAPAPAAANPLGGAGLPGLGGGLPLAGGGLPGMGGGLPGMGVIK